MQIQDYSSANDGTYGKAHQITWTRKRMEQQVPMHRQKNNFGGNYQICLHGFMVLTVSLKRFLI